MVYTGLTNKEVDESIDEIFKFAELTEFVNFW
jgi:ABC-type polysaccharide/polyol phosphate transport system ATPase subunit